MYDTVFWMFLAAGFIGVAALAVGGLLGPKKGVGAKIEAYESGVPPSARQESVSPSTFT
jgi:NADH:ubiquinone oxidoreductase subunit 3 (subunit A)